MVITSSDSGVRWGREHIFAEVPILNRWLGLDAKPNFDLKNNPLPLRDVGDKERRTVAFGEEEGTVNYSATLSTPFILSMIWAKEANVATSGSGKTAQTIQLWSMRSRPPTATVEMRLNGEDGDVRQRYRGTVVTSLRVNSTIGDYTNIDVGMKSGFVDVDTTTYAEYDAVDEPDFPFTFEFGAAYLEPNGKLNDTKRTALYTRLDDESDTTNKLGEVEMFSFDVQTGNDLQYDHDTTRAVGAYDGEVTYTGSLKYALRDASILQRIKDRSEARDGVLVFRFSNKRTLPASDKRKQVVIQVIFEGVNFSEGKISLDGIQRIFNDCTWEANSCRVRVITKYTSRNPGELSAPTGLSSRGLTATTIPLTWTKATGATGYRVYYGTSPNPTTAFTPDFGDVATGTITGLTAGTQYYVRIASLKGGVVASATSADITATTPSS